MQSVASGMKIALSRDVHKPEDNDKHCCCFNLAIRRTNHEPTSPTLTQQDNAVVFIDHQPQMTFGVANIDRATLINNVTLLAKVAKEQATG